MSPTRSSAACVLLGTSLLLSVSPAHTQMSSPGAPSSVIVKRDFPPLPPATPDTPFPFVAEKRRGWHFYEPLQEEIEIQPEEPLPPPPAPAPPAAAAEPAGPRPLSPAWIRENLPKYLDMAVDDPSPQNVSNYLYLQKYAMDASERFSRVYQRVALADPNLDETASSPNWGGARASLKSKGTNAKQDIIRALAKEWGIWFFYRSDCEPCHIQAPVLANFAKFYGFTVLPISMNGGALPNSPFGKHVVDTGQAASLGVTGTPTILLAKPPSTVIPLSYGMSSIPELEQRLLELGNELGAVTPEQYQSTRIDRRQLMTPAGSADLSRLDPSDPASVRNYLKSLITARK